MDFFARHSALRRSVALLLNAILCACASWQPVLGPQGYVTASRPEHVRAVFTSGAFVELYAPAVVGDQLTGCREKGNEASRISIPMQKVARVEVKRVDATRTSLLAGTVGLTVMMFAVAAASWHGIGGASYLPRLDQVAGHPR